MTINEIIAEIRSDYHRFDNMGAFDDVSMYRWAVEALKRFGALVTEKMEAMVEVNNTYAALPENFFSLYVAFRCEPVGYDVVKPCDGLKDEHVQASWMWTERAQRGFEWSSCDPCKVRGSHNVVKESVSIKLPETDSTGLVDYYYRTVPLSLGGRFRKSNIHRECRNRLVKDSPYEINIMGNTLQANFQEGDIYLQYYGIPVDDAGNMEIPDTPRSMLERYVSAYVTMQALEKVMINYPETGVANMFQYFVGQEMDLRGQALTDLKSGILSREAMMKLKRANRRDMRRYELMMPNHR